MNTSARALWFSAGAALTVLAMASGANAQQRTFDLPSQDARTSIPEFARQAGVQISAPVGQLSGVQTSAVRGTMDERIALKRLLTGTGLSVAADNGEMIILRKAAARLTPVATQPQIVVAQAEPMPEPSPAPEAARATDQPQEVVVTAQRRSERLQDVPVAVTALSPKQMQLQHIVDLKSLTSVAPSLYTGGTTLDASALAVSIRGVNSLSLTVLQEPGVGLYVDGVYIPRTDGSNLGMVDLQQVEVLRGPQGTLFGRNTIGGAITLTTNQPTNRFEGDLEATLGNYNERDFTGVINVPIIDGKLAARMVLQHRQHDGYTRDSFLNTNIGADHSNYLRFSVKATPTENWSVVVAADVLSDDADAQPAKVLFVTPGSPTSKIPAANGNVFGPLVVGGDLFTDQADFAPVDPLNAAGASATVTGSFPWGTFRDIVGYRHMHVLRNLDSDGTQYPIIHNFGSPAFSDAISNEAQLFGKSLNDRLDWIGGFYYFRETGGDGLSNLALPALFGNNLTNTSDTATNTSYAVYGQITYAILPTVKFTAGVRYTYDDKRVQWIADSQNIATGAITCSYKHFPGTFVFDPTTCQTAPASAHFSYLPYTLKLEYQPTRDINIYGSYSVGFRSGGFPNAGGAVVQAYLPFSTEESKTFEVGAKTQWFDHHLRVNVAGFYTDYDNIQLSTIQLTAPVPPATVGTPFSSIVNSGRGRILGGEFEAAAFIGKLELNGSFSALDAKYTSGPYVGRPFLIVPNYTASVGATYPIDTSLGVLTLHADYDWRSRVQFQYNSPQGSLTDILDGQNAVGLLNASITLELKDSPISFELWGNNITNQHYLNWVSNNTQSLGGEYGIAAAPVTFGGTVRYRFRN